MKLRAYLFKQIQRLVREAAESLPIPPTPYYRVEMPPKDKAVMVYDNQLLAGKNVLITGAGQNIGRSIALEMAQQGATIYFTEINIDSCQAVEQELIRLSPQSRGFQLNILHADEQSELLAWLDVNDIQIDVLVNNIGKNGATIKTEELDIEEWKNNYEINLFGPIALTKEIAARMIANDVRGNIIFLTSIHQELASRWPSYSSAKAALASAVKELALDLAPKNIRVNGIAPGAVTKFEDDLLAPEPHTPLYQTTIDPDYIGRTAVYLASDYFSRFTTGIIMKIDAGLTLVSARSIQEKTRVEAPLLEGIP